jgi:hypothetical protein
MLRKDNDHKGSVANKQKNRKLCGRDSQGAWCHNELNGSKLQIVKITLTLTVLAKASSNLTDRLTDLVAVII